MANVIDFAAERRRVASSFIKKGGYNTPFPEIISRYYEHARGTKTDIYTAYLYKDAMHKMETPVDDSDGPIVELIRGFIPPKNDEPLDPDLRNQQLQLIKTLDELSAAAEKELRENPNFIFQEQRANMAYVFIKCDKGVIGCGYCDNSHARKKCLKMAAFLAYAIGYINAEIDPTTGKPIDADLWERAHSYLPYDSELGRSDVADEIIEAAIVEGPQRS